jgi:hypothetical protein
MLFNSDCFERCKKIFPSTPSLAFLILGTKMKPSFGECSVTRCGRILRGIAVRLW